jgi:hypothetical protein
MASNHEIEQLKDKLTQLEQQLRDVLHQGAPANIAAIAKTLKGLEDVETRRQTTAAKRLASLKSASGLSGLATAATFMEIPARLSNPDELATRALNVVKNAYAGKDAEARAFIQDKGIVTELTRLTTALNSSGALDETHRLLVADPDIYGALVLSVLGPSGADRAKLDRLVADKEGFRVSVLAKMNEDDGPVHRFARALATASLKRSGAALDETTLIGKRLVAELRAHSVPLGAGRVESAIELVHEQLISDGPFPALVDAYVATREVDPSKFTPEIRRAMVAHLIARGVSIDPNDAEQQDRFTNGGYDEYFAVAYNQAASSAGGGDDPLVAAATKGASVAPWDFTVDTFESIEEQGLVKENILAAGALDYVFELGERLGIFRLADALTLNWAAGAIDVVDGPCANKLYRYWKLRDQRSDPAERGLVYKRVLNKGDVEALDRMVVNESFEQLWGTLAEKVTEYRQKIERANAEAGETLLVSRAPIYQAVRDLQYNLTEFCTGMAHMQVREMYSQLRDAMDLLGDPEIVDHFAGGRRKTMWTAIERLARSEFGEAPNINSIRIAAVEGNAMFRFIANFHQGAVTEEQFQRFLDATEAWIIAKGSDSSGVVPVSPEGEIDEEDDDFNDDEN